MMECDNVLPRSEEDPNTVKTINVTAPLARFFVGIFEGFIGNKVSWYRCLPEKYFIDTIDIGSEGIVQEKFAQLSETLQKVLTITKNVVK
jgi:hypothetical protein